MTAPGPTHPSHRAKLEPSRYNPFCESSANVSRLTTAAVVLLVALLAVDILAANALVAADRTVLNAGFVTTTLEEENAYAQAEPIVLDQLPTEDLGGDLPAGFEALLLGIAGQVTDAVFLQSAVLVGLGIVLFLAGLALRLGLFERAGGAQTE